MFGTILVLSYKLRFTTCYFSTPRFKQKFSFITPTIDNELAVLDALKLCDAVVFLLSTSGGVYEDNLIDKWGQNILLSSFSQGLPTPVVVVTDLESVAQKKRHDYKQQVQKVISKWLPGEKVMNLDNDTDGINLLRKIGNQKRRTVLYRDRRPHIYAENVEFVPNSTGNLMRCNCKYSISFKLQAHMEL